MPNFTAGTSFTDGVTNDVTAAKLNALIADAVPTSSLSLNSTTGTISQFSSGTGTAASPAIQPTGDTNTGIFFPAADNIAVSTNGTERVRVDSSGNVGIGTASPSTKLDVLCSPNAGIRVTDGTQVGIMYASGVGGIVAGTTSTHPYILYSNNTERLRIDSSGNVGIGTTSPISKLHVGSSVTNTGVSATFGAILCGNGQTTANLTDSGNHQASLFLKSTGIESGDGGAILFGAYNLNNRYFAAIKGFITNGNGSTSGDICFSTRNAITDTSLTERLRITSGGEVYIAGTTDQGAYNLQVNGTGVWGAGAYVNGSDERLKENIQDITSGLDVVEKLRPVSFQYKEDYTADRSVQSGFIAQDLLVALEGKNYLDGIVSQGPTYYNVAYQNLIPILAKAIQDLKAINDSQAQAITSLESRITALEAA